MTDDITHRQRVVLAALAAGGGGEFAPVQVQKLFFLLDENVADAIGGRQFAFEPYDYGPFDQAVYRELETLEALGLVRIDRSGRAAGRRSYALTPCGQSAGEEALADLPACAREYMVDVVKWVRGQPFAQLVGAIYRMYPHMRENSIFTG